MRILIVEDDFGSRRLMQKMMAQYGKVDVVVDGDEAIEAFRLGWEDNEPYDCICLDIMMPKVDGQEALREIREIEKGYGVKPFNAVKVLMVTALEDPKNVIEAFLEGGADGYMVKPITAKKIEEELKKMNL